MDTPDAIVWGGLFTLANAILAAFLAWSNWAMKRISDRDAEAREHRALLAADEREERTLNRSREREVRINERQELATQKVSEKLSAVETATAGKLEEVGRSVKDLEKNTNSMKDELIKAVGDGERAKGFVEGLQTISNQNPEGPMPVKIVSTVEPVPVEVIKPPK